MKETLQIIDQMQRNGAVGLYAIGGAVAASLYVEPFTTKNLDIFLALSTTPDSGILDLPAIYEYLKSRGFSQGGEFVEIGTWPVKFLVATSPLELESVTQASQIAVDNVIVRVISPEHLAAMCLIASRPRDYTLILRLVEEGAINREIFHAILVRHQLRARWEDFEYKFLGVNSIFTRSASLKDEQRRNLRSLPLNNKARVIEEMRNIGMTLSKARRSDKESS